MSGKAALREPLFPLIAAMLAISLVIQFGIQPLMADLKAQALPLDVMQSAFAGQFRMCTEYQHPLPDGKPARRLLSVKTFCK